MENAELLRVYHNNEHIWLLEQIAPRSLNCCCHLSMVYKQKLGVRLFYVSLSVGKLNMTIADNLPAENFRVTESLCKCFFRLFFSLLSWLIVYRPFGKQSKDKRFGPKIDDCPISRHFFTRVILWHFWASLFHLVQVVFWGRSNKVCI